MDSDTNMNGHTCTQKNEKYHALDDTCEELSACQTPMLGSSTSWFGSMGCRHPPIPERPGLTISWTSSVYNSDISNERAASSKILWHRP